MVSIQMLNIDCMEYMATQPDKSFDLAIVDPPYGLGEAGKRSGARSSKGGAQKFWGTKNSPHSKAGLTLPVVTKNDLRNLNARIHRAIFKS